MIDTTHPLPAQKAPGRPRTKPVRATATSVQLLALQARLGLSPQGMADYLGVPLPTYRNWRDGHREPPAAVNRLLDVLGIIEALAPAIHDHLLPRR